MALSNQTAFMLEMLDTIPADRKDSTYPLPDEKCCDLYINRLAAYIVHKIYNGIQVQGYRISFVDPDYIMTKVETAATFNITIATMRQCYRQVAIYSGIQPWDAMLPELQDKCHEIFIAEWPLRIVDWNDENYTVYKNYTNTETPDPAP